MDKTYKTAIMADYFTEDELSEYVDGYIQEGFFTDNGPLYLFPVAKSTEIMMLNTTDWEPFAQATGTTLDELATVEGIVRVAENTISGRMNRRLIFHMTVRHSMAVIPCPITLLSV